MSVYLDTSVLVAAFTEEGQSDHAQSLIATVAGWYVSDWTAAEFSAAIRTKSRRGELLAAQVPILDQALADLISQSARALPIEPIDHREARDLVIADGGLRAPDALHIVAARRVGARLLTFDLNQQRAAMSAGVALYPS